MTDQTTNQQTTERTVRPIIAKGFSHWTKDNLKHFVAETQIPIEDPETDYTKSEYINAITRIQPTPSGKNEKIK